MNEDKFCHPAGYLNQALATFYWHGETQYIPAHQDKAVSAEAEGAVEDKTPIYNLSFGAVRPFLICDLASLGKVDRKQLTIIQEFPMHPGDLFVLTPEANVKYSHCVPRDPTVGHLRISLVFRHVTKHWIKEVNAGVYEYYSVTGGERGAVTTVSELSSVVKTAAQIPNVPTPCLDLAGVDETAETTARPRRRPKRKVCEVAPPEPPRALAEEAEAELQPAEEHSPLDCHSTAD